MLETLIDIFQFVQTNMITIVFMTIYVMLVGALIRLHFSKDYEKFNVASLITSATGALDFGKLRVVTIFFGTTYAFFWLLQNHADMFNNYAALYVTLWLTHQVADKMSRTNKDKQDDVNPNIDALTAAIQNMNASNGRNVDGDTSVSVSVNSDKHQDDGVLKVRSYANKTEEPKEEDDAK